MPRQPFPNSQALASADYDAERRELSITFRSGRTYTYREVPEDVYEGLVEADSPGAYWRASIKDQFS